MHIFFRIMSFFNTDFFILYQVHHSQSLPPACGALVFHYVTKNTIYYVQLYTKITTMFVFLN